MRAAARRQNEGKSYGNALVIRLLARGNERTL
jgi:hypothetical protein